MSSGSILVVNAGSSSLKFSLFRLDAAEALQLAVRGQIDGIGSRPRLKVRDDADRTLVERDLASDEAREVKDAIAIAGGWLREQFPGEPLLAVGHRVVHGGADYSRPVLVDENVYAALEKLIPLAPLHEPHNLAAIRAVRETQPQLPQVACFDTAFHRRQPELAQHFALPRALTAAGVRRYGFHGLSYEYIAEVLPQHLAAGHANGRVIVAHLGNGASMCALKERRSIASTMGFTALDGLMMGTRCGAIDPGVLLYLMEHHGMDAAAISHLLYQESGLLGVSGIAADMRTLLASNRPEAGEAVDLFCYRIVREIGSLAAALGGLDALVFTGGIGEHAIPVREKVCAQLGWLGVELDGTANASAPAGATQPRQVSTPASQVSVHIIPANEEWMIARHTAELIGHRDGRKPNA